MKSPIGQTVHYVSYGTPGGEYARECRAAVITEVPAGVRDPQTVGLAVLNPTGVFFNRTNPRDDGKLDQAGGTGLCGGLDYAGGSWHWPDRVPDPTNPEATQ